MVNDVMKIGFGYDVHPLVSGRKLVLGGVEIPFARGLNGHSDADVLAHAIGDALLGAAGLGDIGRMFPDTSPLYKDISSLLILEKIKDELRGKNLKIGNIDASVVIEEPKISPYVETMQANISKVLEIFREAVNIKATTQEKLGFLGKGQGAAAFAVVLLNEDS
ncbi:MAG: 2-C-methyl-D-erythritol 2,4-cyclodiphosphate synthase [Candidatus Ratteibacteria bacterium]|nr:2-C-methyl-D-erythritol 2,4-cyclodiphosphate synthase [Candidatus Ratteibacteria bacterium]